MTPTVVVRGTTPAHAETVDALADGGAWVLPVVEDAGWNGADEFSLLDAHPAEFGDALPTRQEFQGWFDAAHDRWSSGDFDHDYAESWAAFTTRVDEALRRTVELTGVTGTTVVVTSAGPLAWVAAALLSGPDGQSGRAALWGQLNRVVVNSAVTKVGYGATGLRLVSFNEHTHLEASVQRQG